MWDENPGFVVKSFDGKIQGLSFQCRECVTYDSFVTPDKISKNGRYVFGNDCCQTYKATEKDMAAAQIVGLQLSQSAENGKKEEARNAFNGLFILAVLPIVAGIFTGSSNLIGIGILVLLMYVAYWYIHLRHL